MYQTERMDEIMKILKKYGYVTVDYLVEQIRYSPASIRRDLTLLEKQGLVHRSYGGVEIKEDVATPFVFRQHSMKAAKNKMALEAAKLVNDGDTVFIDGSSSAQYVGHFLTDKKNITVVTNNMILASQLAENGLKVYCTGGYVDELPGILTGEITTNTYSRFCADIMLFSAGGVGEGYISSGSEVYIRHHRQMLDNSRIHVCLCASDKIDKTRKLILCKMDEIDYFITDSNISQETIEKYPNTTYIRV